MEQHGIASAKTVVPADEIVEAATEPGEAPDAATLRPRQDTNAEGAQPGTQPTAAEAAVSEAAAVQSARTEAARQAAVGPPAPGGGDDWQSQPPPPSGMQQPPANRPSGGSADDGSSPAAGGPERSAPLPRPQEPTSARRTGSGGAQVQQLPDLGSGFGPADTALRRSASDAGGSGSWPPPGGAANAAGASGRHGSDELPGGNGRRQLRSRSAAPTAVAANGNLAPSSLMSLAGAVLDQRCDTTQPLHSAHLHVVCCAPWSFPFCTLPVACEGVLRHPVLQASPR